MLEMFKVNIYSSDIAPSELSNADLARNLPLKC